jgi:predicted Zn-dependent protease with MMP-like domain
MRSVRRARRLRLLPRFGRDGHSTIEEAAGDGDQKAGAMTREAFRKLVDEALETIPENFRDALTNIAIVVEDEPSSGILEEVGIEPPDTLLGLYQGTPLTERQWAHGNALPDKVTLFQHPIEDASEDDDDVVVAIGETLIHELGHYFGLSEDEIETIEEQYWRGGRDPDDADDA